MQGLSFGLVYQIAENEILYKEKKGVGLRKELYLSQNSSGRRSKHQGASVWYESQFGHNVVDKCIGNWPECKKAKDLTL